MKITRRIVLVLATILTMSSLQAQVRSADSMVHKIFATLKAKDEKAFVALYPNPHQFGRFMRNIMEQAMKSDEMKKMMEMDEKSKGMNLDSLIEAQVTAISSPEAFGQMEKAFGTMFQKIIEKGEKKGVKWSEAKLTNFTFDSSAIAGEGTPFSPTGIKEAKGVIDFTVGSEPYQLAYSKVMYLESEGGWFGAEFPQLARKGESLQPDTEQEVSAGDATPQKQKATGTKGKAAVKGKTTATKAPVRKKVKS